MAELEAMKPMTVFLLWCEQELLGVYASAEDAKRAAEEELPVGRLRWLELKDKREGVRRMWWADHPAPFNYRIVEAVVGQRY